MSDIVVLESGEFRWEYVEGKGRCLVPIDKERGLVTAQDIEKGRKYKSGSRIIKGDVIEIVLAYTPEGRSFYTLRRQKNSYCYSYCSYYEKYQMADHINRASRESDACFGAWID